MTGDLPEWLGEQLDEDERLARESIEVRERAWGYDPHHHLREIDAKRAVLTEHAIRDGRCRVCAARANGNWTRFRAPCNTLRLLALPYADRPGYDEALAAFE